MPASQDAACARHKKWLSMQNAPSFATGVRRVASKAKKSSKQPLSTKNMALDVIVIDEAIPKSEDVMNLEPANRGAAVIETDEEDLCAKVVDGSSADQDFHNTLVSEMELYLRMEEFRFAIVKDIPKAHRAFIRRREKKRQVLKQLAEECAKVGPLIRQRAAEIREAAAEKHHLDVLRRGDLDAYRQVVTELKKKRLKEILDETKRILAQVGHPGLSNGDQSTDWIRAKQPAMLQNVEMMPHQLRGLHWLSGLFDNGMSGILADDMGLGKTLQVVALLAFLLENREVTGPHLVLVPKGTLRHWHDEFRRWAPGLTVGMIFRSKSVENVLGNARAHVVVASYDNFLVNRTAFLTPVWYSVIIDEGHRLKNYRSIFSQVVRKIQCRQKLLLTGTPLQNNLRELWSLLAFVAPHQFGNLADFEEWFQLPPPPKIDYMAGYVEAVGTNANKEANRNLQSQSPSDGIGEIESTAVESSLLSKLSEDEELLMVQRLHGVLRPFLLRRTKALVLKDLPAKKEVVIWVPLSAWQEALYKSYLHKFAKSNQATLRRSRAGGILGIRSVVNSPYKEEDWSKTDLQEETKLGRLCRSSGKLEFLERCLPRLLRFGHKIVIFSQFRYVLDMVVVVLSEKGLQYERIDGTHSINQRERSLYRFNSSSTINVLLLTTRAAGVGLNLQVADTVLIFDPDFNPQMDVQAMDRIHRIGQKRQVLSIRLLTTTGLDRGIMNRNKRKIDIEKEVIGAGNFHYENDPKSKPVQEDSILRQLLSEARSGGSSVALGGNDGKNLNVTEVNGPTPLHETNRLLARSPEEFEAFNAADTELLGRLAEGTTEENFRQRLELAGRLIPASEVPDAMARYPDKEAPDKCARPRQKGLKRRWRGSSVW